MENFKNKVVWVIGASSGIGEELCKQLALDGARIILSARNFDVLEKLRFELNNPHIHCSKVIDLADQSSFPTICEELVEQYGHIDYLFNNGGISQRGKASDTPIEVDRKIMEVNYFGNIALAKAILPIFQKQQAGHYVITSSLSGKFGFFLRSAYCASKHALHGFYESLYLEEEQNGVKVTIVCPGKINTPISMSALNSDGVAHGVMDHNQATGMPVSECVHLVLKAVKKEKKEVLIGNKEILAAKIKRFAPALFWKIIKKQSAT